MPDSIADVIANDLRRLPQETRKVVRRNLRKAGEVTAAATRANASWSTRIPGAVKVRTSFRLDREGVEVTVGGPSVPHARPYEGVQRSWWRHPVHADPAKTHAEWVWVRQEARPFLRPAGKSTEGQVTGLMREALDEAGTKLGFP